MELYTAIVATIAPIILGIVGILFIKNYLPSYFDKKAENLATKEDIGVIIKEEEVARHLTKSERDFYDEIIKAIYVLLAEIKKYEFENKQLLKRDTVLEDPKLKATLFQFVDAINEILGRAFVFLPEENFISLKNAIRQKGSLNDLVKGSLLAMRKSIHPDTRLEETDIIELQY